MPYVFASGALFLLSTLEDLPGDRAMGLATSAAAWGETRVRAATLALAAAALLAAIPGREWPALAWSIAALPGYLRVLRAKEVALGFRVNQLAGRLLVVLALLGALAALGLLAGVVAASRVYHRLRFGLDYPRLTLDPAAPRGRGPR